MKITKLQLAGPSIVDLPLEHEEVEGPYLLKGADGLGPVDVEILNNGKTRALDREIVMLIGLQPAWDVGQRPEELRAALYDLVTSRFGSTIQVRLMDGATQKAYAEARVKKLVPGLFGQDPEVQLTVGCVEPTRSYFLAPAEVNQQPTPSGSISVTNTGDAPTGFRLGIQFTGAVSAATGVIITDGHTGGQAMKVYRNFNAGDRLYIDTRDRKKGVWMKLSGQPALLPIMESFSVDSDWSTFHRGSNQIVVNQPYSWPSDGGVTHTPAYQGV